MRICHTCKSRDIVSKDMLHFQCNNCGSIDVSKVMSHSEAVKKIQEDAYYAGWQYLFEWCGYKRIDTNTYETQKEGYKLQVSVRRNMTRVAIFADSGFTTLFQNNFDSVEQIESLADKCYRLIVSCL